MSDDVRMCDCNQGRLPCTCKRGEQQHGEPVALPARLPMRSPEDRNLPKGYADAWNACLDEIAKLGPLYTRPAPADAGEVEQLREDIELLQSHLGAEIARCNSAESMWRKCRDDRKDLQAQLDERDALLRRARPAISMILNALDRNSAEGKAVRGEIAAELRAALSASAEPSGPKCETCPDHGAVGNILNAEPCPDCSYGAPVERDGLDGVDDVAKSISERMKARAALERKP